MNQWIATLQPYLTFIKDLVTIASLAVAAAVAIKGLQTWRRQLKGAADHDLARKVLKSTYRLRDTLQAVRSPLITGGEFAHAIKELQLEAKIGDPDFDALRTAAVYQLRWRPVIDAYQALELETIEAEALWGPQARDAISRIRRSVNTLSSALDFYLQDLHPDRSMLDHASRDSFRRTIFSVSHEPDKDPYLAELTSAVNAFEELARPFLIR